MLRLMRKDLLVHRTGIRMWGTLLVLVLVFQACRGFSPSFYVVLACTYGTILPAVLVTFEDKSHAGPFNCSLPVTRRQIVRAKYVISWALALVMTVVGLVLYSVIAAETPFAIWTMGTVEQALVSLSLGLGFTLPALLRFGFWGFTVAFVVMNSLWMIMLLVLGALFDLHLAESFTAISDFVAKTRAQLGVPRFLAVVVVAGGVWNVVSCELAVALFKRKEF